MTSFSPCQKVWKTHKRREYFDRCPRCGKPLKWIYDGVDWLPCDYEPVLFMLHPSGRSRVVYHRKVFENALLYRPGDQRFNGTPLTGYIQHYYTCKKGVNNGTRELED